MSFSSEPTGDTSVTEEGQVLPGIDAKGEYIDFSPLLFAACSIIDTRLNRKGERALLKEVIAEALKEGPDPLYILVGRKTFEILFPEETEIEGIEARGSVAELADTIEKILLYKGADYVCIEEWPDIFKANFINSETRKEFEAKLAEATHLPIPLDLARQIYLLENHGPIQQRGEAINKLNCLACQHGLHLEVVGGSRSFRIMKCKNAIPYQRGTKTIEERNVKKHYPCGDKIEENIPPRRR